MVSGVMSTWNTWSPLWSGLVDSSIWDESDTVCKVFITMLALKDSDHVVRLNAYQLGKRARKSEVEVLEALKVLCSPDKRRVEQQEYGGRRVRAVPEGWLILNGEKYREKVRLEMKRARNRKAQAAWRARQKALREGPHLPGEDEFDRGQREGRSEAELDQTVTDHLPKP